MHHIGRGDNRAQPWPESDGPVQGVTATHANRHGHCESESSPSAHGHRHSDAETIGHSVSLTESIPGAQRQPCGVCHAIPNSHHSTRGVTFRDDQ